MAYCQNASPTHEVWLTDSGATKHMTSNVHNLQNVTSYALDDAVHIGYGESLPILKQGLNSVLTKVVRTDISQLSISANFTDEVISTTPLMPTSAATQPSLYLALSINNAPPSQVFNPLQIAPTSPLSISTNPRLQQVLLKEIEALQTPNTWLVSSTLVDRSLMNCRKERRLWCCGNLCHSFLLIKS